MTMTLGVSQFGCECSQEAAGAMSSCQASAVCLDQNCWSCHRERRLSLGAAALRGCFAFGFQFSCNCYSEQRPQSVGTSCSLEERKAGLSSQAVTGPGAARAVLSPPHRALCWCQRWRFALGEVPQPPPSSGCSWPALCPP